MKYTENYNFKKPEDDDIYDIQNENDNIDSIDFSLKTTIMRVESLVQSTITSIRKDMLDLSDSVTQQLRTTLATVEQKIADLTTYVNEKVASVVDKIEDLVSSKVDEKIADHKDDHSNPHQVTLSQVLGSGSSGIVPVANGGTGITSNPSMLINLGSSSAANVFQTSPRPGVTGSLTVARGGTGKTGYSSTNMGIEYRGIQITDTVPTSVTAGTIVLVY